MFGKVLIANRGAIACRIMRTLRGMGVASVAVYSAADRHSLHVRMADEAVEIGPAPAAQSYLSVEAILRVAAERGAEAIHPGYGFLSENAEFAEACARAGIVFIGPTPEQMRQFGLKHTAREIARANGVPLLPGTDLLNSPAEAADAARAIGYPVMLKSTAGGGGIGMRLCRGEAELSAAYEAVERQSRAAFGSTGLYLEKLVEHARHIEVQIFGDGAGNVIALGERDCSAQRRNQKVIEETPAPGLAGATRAALFDAAVRLGRAVRYRSAGTVEFIYDAGTGAFYFLEVNTRLQVEHGVTEEVAGIDLVEWMVRQAAGEAVLTEVSPSGASIQVRLYAEDPARDFQPSSGTLGEVAWPADARVETWIESGSEITPYYDPMLAKIIVRGADRAQALARLREALAGCRVAGIETNLEYLRQVADDAAFARGGVTTSFLRTLPYQRRAVEVIDAGVQTTVQDYPGRLGYWHVGVPPSGPMDALAFRAANRLVGNPDGTAALEIAVMGPALRFACEATIALTGADFDARVDGDPLPRWRAVTVRAGATLAMSTAQGSGARAYLAISGGIDVPEYLGSRATFILGKFGGHAGRPLRAGDVLHLATLHAHAPAAELTPPRYTGHWDIAVLYGPHGAPDFFTAEDIATFFAARWKVHHNSDRTGVRLIGPKPVWARKDGGEAGLHPSNIHDNAYAIGTVDFTGDMPVILGPDGPSLGGFVCPATIVHAELWKMGQLRPGDTVGFHAVTPQTAAALEDEVERYLAHGGALRGTGISHADAAPAAPVLRSAPGVVCREAGDRNLLVEYGANVLDLNLRFRVHALEQLLRAAGLAGILDLTPGVRSLQIHYDPRRLPRAELLVALDDCERRIPDLDDISAPSRTVHLPLSWEDPATLLAIRRYMQSVRPDAPWCPSNIEFIRRINGLGSVDEVKRIVFDASYLVLGLGDVYLGAPVATPVDPRHRLVTTKYNPARTWTPENAVGIGGAYLCVYGMEGPGGYQFVGRTVQMWNTWRGSPPWLLRFFDRIRFYEVSAPELAEIRETFPRGGYPLRIEEGVFRPREYHAFADSIRESASAFKRTQQAAFEAERERWAAAGVDRFEAPAELEPRAVQDAVPEGCRPVVSPVSASVWNVAVEAGQRVQAGQKLIVLEAMKMEIAVAAPRAGVVERLNCAPGALVTAGQSLVTLRDL
ncbi:MAG: urea carboxylase [Acidobacteria bacterium]|nr:urea carboxylase [Acidobacteriota bacterium]